MHITEGKVTAIVISILFGIILGFSGIARADIAAIRSSNNAAELDVGTDSLDYAETSTGATLDTEKGWMPSIGGGLTYMAKSAPQDIGLLDNLYLHIDGFFDLGSTAYNGAVCSGPDCTPATGTTNDQIFTLSTKIGSGIELNDTMMLTPFVDFGYRTWNRQLTGLGGYTEEYDNGDVMAGAMIQFSPAESPIVVSLSGEGGTTLFPSMSTSGTSYTLQDEAMWKLSGKIGYAFAQRWELTGTIDYTRLGFGASPAIASIYEPDSTTSQVTALVGIAWHFQCACADSESPTPIQ